jgi:hypothetical protein
LRVFENKVIRIFGPKREEVTGAWRKLGNEEFRNLYSSPDNIMVIKQRRMRWAEHVARMGVRRNAYIIQAKTLEGRHHLGDPGVDGRILLKWFLKK